MAARKPEHIKALYVEAKGKSEAALLWLGINLMHREHKSISWTGKALRERREYLKLNTADGKEERVVKGMPKGSGSHDDLQSGQTVKPYNP